MIGSKILIQMDGYFVSGVLLDIRISDAACFAVIDDGSKVPRCINIGYIVEYSAQEDAEIIQLLRKDKDQIQLVR